MGRTIRFDKKGDVVKKRPRDDPERESLADYACYRCGELGGNDAHLCRACLEEEGEDAYRESLIESLQTEWCPECEGEGFRDDPSPCKLCGGSGRRL